MKQFWLLIIVTAVGCSSPQSSPSYTVQEKTDKVVEVTLHGVKIGSQESIPVFFHLERKKRGETLKYDEVYADPEANDNSGRAGGGRLQIEYVVGEGVKSVRWNDKEVPLDE